MAAFVRFFATLSLDTFLFITLAPFAVAFAYAYVVPRTSVRMLAFVILRLDIALTLLRIVGGATIVGDGSRGAEVVLILVFINIGFILQAYKNIQVQERRDFPDSNNWRPLGRRPRPDEPDAREAPQADAPAKGAREKPGAKKPDVPRLPPDEYDQPDDAPPKKPRRPFDRPS